MRQASLNIGVLQLAITSLSVHASQNTRRQSNSIQQIIKMDAQTKNEIISEITATAGKTIEQTVGESLKKALPEDFVDKTTDEAVKRIKSSTVPEFKNKGNRIRYEANNSIMVKINEATSALKKVK